MALLVTILLAITASSLTVASVVTHRDLENDVQQMKITMKEIVRNNQKLNCENEDLKSELHIMRERLNNIEERKRGK